MKFVVLISALAVSACAPAYESTTHSDQCMRERIFLQCLETVKNGSQATYKDLGPLVDECASAIS